MCPRRILVYCKFHLLSPATNTTVTAITLTVDAIRSSAESRRFGLFAATDFAGMRIILDLTATLERLRSDLRLLSRARTPILGKKTMAKHPLFHIGDLM